MIWSNVDDNASAKTCQAVPADPGATTGNSLRSRRRIPPRAAPTHHAELDPVELLQPLRVPAVSVDLVLPWFTGNPYALYARVRAVGTKGPSGWSKSFGFNMQWQSRPAPLAVAVRPRPLVDRRGRDRLPGVVPADQEVDLDQHEHRR